MYSGLVLVLLVSSCLAGSQVSKSAATQISVKDATLSFAGGADGKTTSHSLTAWKKHASSLPFDGHQQLTIKFTVVNQGSTEAREVHQAFVIFTNPKDNHEVAFVAGKDAKTKEYSLVVNLKTHGKDFGGVSGSYIAHLVLGDVTIQPVDWEFAQLEVRVPPAVKKPVPVSQQVFYEPKPEIKHLFREPEARPSAFFGTVFGIACVVPLLLVLILWLTIGISFGNLPLSPWVLGFHGGLAAIFGIYFLFWLHLNMFETLYYLGIAVIPTFFFGHRLFRTLASQK